jgi:hypothetical protein
MPRRSRRFIELAALTALVTGAAVSIDACTSLEGLGGGVDSDAGADAGDAAFSTDTARASANDTGKTCIANSDCASGVCVQVGTDDAGVIHSACTTPCAKTSDCVAGWSCAPEPGMSASVCQCHAAADECDGKDNDCNGKVDDGASDACRRANGGSSGWACTNGACSCAGAVCAATDAGPAACTDLASDVLHCGACNAVCPANAPCVASRCKCPGANGALCPANPGGTLACGDDGACRVETVLATGDVVYFEATATGVLYADIFSSTVSSVAKAGGASAIVTTVPQSVIGIDADGANMVVLSPSAIKACVLPGCTQPVTFNVTAAAAITFNNYVYWMQSSNGAIEARAADGSGVTTEIFAGPPSGVASGALAADASGIYVAYVDGEIYLVTPGNGGTFIAGVGPPHAFAVDGTRIYVATDAGLATCSKIPAVCNNVPTFLVNGAIRGVTADSSHVYWSTAAGIFGCLPGSCASPTKLIAKTNLGNGLLQHDDSLYFLYTGGVARVTK